MLTSLADHVEAAERRKSSSNGLEAANHLFKLVIDPRGNRTSS
jgi:hypothetical protein